MFKLVSDFSPKGDQPVAIEKLTTNIKNGVSAQTLLGATGTGKTFTIANVINNIQKKTLVIAHNKTLAGQLYSELKGFFPENRVEYFISYYDYFQPESYVPKKDLFIEKASTLNEEIDMMRNATVASLAEREDVIVVASVSCIYGAGNIHALKGKTKKIAVGEFVSIDMLISSLIDIHYQRNDFEVARGSFKVKGDILDICMTYDNNIVRIIFEDDCVRKIRVLDGTTKDIVNELEYVSIFPASLFIIEEEHFDKALRDIEEELEIVSKDFERQGKILEQARIVQRTNFDLENIREFKACLGIENYSRHFEGRSPGTPPYTLMDFFGDDFLVVVDESHMSIPQIRGMYAGDRSRKLNLVEYGFRLPSALDNRPLYFEEFEERAKQVIYVSATPSLYEKNRSYEIVDQIIRPTGLLDPTVEIKKTEGQILDIIYNLNKQVRNNERTLIVTLTVKMAEGLSKYLTEEGIKVAYLHHEIKSIERLDIIRDLRSGKYDCIVGINLLKEGLDIPEVSLILILDADKEGFLRSETALIQLMGRAARNVNGRIIMYADKKTIAMEKAIEETNRRRKIQEEYNKVNNIIPSTIFKHITDRINIIKEFKEDDSSIDQLTPLQLKKLIINTEKEMKQAAKDLDFEKAVVLRDLLYELRGNK